MVEHRIKHHALHRLGTFLLSCRIRLGLDITVAVDEKLTHCPVWVWQLVPKMVMQKSIGILWSSAAACVQIFTVDSPQVAQIRL